MIRRQHALSFVAGLTAAVLLGCSSTAPLSDPNADVPEAAPAHTLIYIIHGDGDYLYHENGAARRADREALAEARLVARHAPDTEVFIFHQRPRRSLLGLLPLPDGAFYHYRDGELVEDESYRRDPSGTGLSREAALYHEHRHPEVPARSLLYYGHHVEEGGGSRYHASYPEHVFGLDELVGGLEALGGGVEPFDLVVFSTCNNGTPGTVATLAPLTRYVLASPGNLHLSYIDSHPLHRAATVDGGLEMLAPQLAEWAYERLVVRTETAVTLVLYDTERLTPFLEQVEPVYEAARVRLPSGGPNPLPDFVDCREEALPELNVTTPGVQQWYRPPSFGRQSQQETHSGWGCPIVERLGD